MKIKSPWSGCQQTDKYGLTVFLRTANNQWHFRFLLTPGYKPSEKSMPKRTWYIHLLPRFFFDLSFCAYLKKKFDSHDLVSFQAAEPHMAIKRTLSHTTQKQVSHVCGERLFSNSFGTRRTQNTIPQGHKQLKQYFCPEMINTKRKLSKNNW